MVLPSRERAVRMAGDILLEAGSISLEELRRAQAFADEAGCGLCEALGCLRLVDESRIAHAMSRENGLPWVDLGLVAPKEEWLRWIPRFVAEQYMLVPVYVRTRGVGKTIVYVAMEDPTDQEALRACSSWAGLEVRPMVAARSEIDRCIQHWYPASEQDSERMTAPPPTVRQDPPGAFDCRSGVYERAAVTELDDLLEATG